MIRIVFTAAALALFAGPALADPCTRIPDRGPLPAEARPGQVFSGRVAYVGDGDSLCVETVRGVGGAGWVEVRLSDFRAIELNQPGRRAARQALVEIVMDRRITCRARNRTWDRIAAACVLNGVPLGDLMRRRGVPEGGR